MKKRRTRDDAENVTAGILNALGRGPSAPPTHHSTKTSSRFNDCSDEDEDLSGSPDYRSDTRAKTFMASGPLELHPATVRDLAKAVASVLQFHPDTIRNLAKAIVVNLQLLPETIQQLAKAIYGLLQKDMAALVEHNTMQADGKVACSVCAVGNSRYPHPHDDMTVAEVASFMKWTTKETVYSRTRDGKMPPPVSTIVPHTYDPHVIALLRYEKLIFPQARYDRDIHLALLPTVEAEEAKKRADFHEKQSAMMTARNARDREDAAKRKKLAAISGKRVTAPKSTVRGKTKSKKR
jgi:hypothetical protein